MGTKRALLIGINAYPNLERQFRGSRPLSGCLKDVDTMTRLLRERGFDDIRPVRDDGEVTPTRRHILEAMHALYDDVAQAARESSSPTDADVVVFFFAGHGSQIRSRGVPGSPLQEHTFQTLVTSDSGRTLPRSQGPSLPNRDLFDFEIDAWVRRLRRLSPAPAVTLIFDCCHSAGVSSDQRGATAETPQTSTERSAPVDIRDWDALKLDGSAQQAWQERDQSSIGPTRGVSGWRRRTLQEAMVIAACRNEETSMGNAQGGFLTHALSKALERYPNAPSWKHVFDPLHREELTRLTSNDAVHQNFAPIYSKVNGRNRNQHPVRHGDGPIFGLGRHDYQSGYPDAATSAPLKTFAVVIGISDYGSSWTDLRNARRDAEAMAETLRQQQGYDVLTTSSGAPALCDQEATFLGIFRHLNRLRRTVRDYRKSASGRNRGAASVIYFAGHGASVPDNERRRVKGYLIPHGGRLDAPQTWLSMSLLRQFLTGPPADDPRPKRRLRSRHLLLILDCCFAGAIRFAPLRRKVSLARPIFASEYRRFVDGQAWQVLTSSSYHQSALDVVRDPRDPRDPGSRHSPFAQALIEALSTGAADASDDAGRRDRILTAGEIHQFMDQRLKVFDFQQPGLAPLSPGNQGQFFFRVPGWQTVATPDPPLDEANNPWPGSTTYDARSGGSDPQPLHGRQAPLLQLLAALLGDEPGPRLLVGASGSGRTSLVLGGLWPLLQDLKAHRHRIRRWVSGLSHAPLLLSPSDLSGVRRWMRELKLAELFHDADALRQRIVIWGQNQGNLTSRDDLSPTEMSGTLPPSLFDLIATERQADHPWWEAARLVELLDRPVDLLFHLRFWHQEPGLADLLLFESEEDNTSEAASHWTPWLKPWHVVYLRGEDLLDTSAWHPESSAWHPESRPPESSAWHPESRPPESSAWHPRRLETHLQDAPTDGPRLLILDDADRLLASPGFRQHGLATLQELERPTSASTLPWRILWILGSHRQALMPGDATARGDGKNSAWQRTVHLLPPSRQQLRDAIEQPLLDRALLMPPHVVDDLVEAAHDTPSPLALLGPCLHAMYEHAVRHRKGKERSLTHRHYSAVGTLTGPWRRRARHTIESVEENDRQAMFRLLRRFAWHPDKPLNLRAVLDPNTSSPPSWLARLLNDRAVVWDASGFKLGHRDLLHDWAAFDSWRRTSPAAPREDTLADLAPRALHWFLDNPPQDRRASSLWNDHADILALLDLHEELNAVERSFLQVSLEGCRARLARRLAGEALRAPERRWNHSLLLAAQALDLARADGLRRSEALARESLRRLLALSPLSLKLDLPGIARRLSWLDGPQLHVLTSAQPMVEEAGPAVDGAAPGDPWHDDWAWQLNLASAQSAPELVAVASAPNVKAPALRFQEAEDGALEAADADRRRFARLVPFAQRVSLEQEGDLVSQNLRGLGKGLRDLAWGPSGAWLAAVCQPEDADAAAPAYGLTAAMKDAVAELRLWRCRPSDHVHPSAQGPSKKDSRDMPPLSTVSEPRSTAFSSPRREISHLTFAAQGTVLIGLERDQGLFCVDLEPPIPVPGDPTRWLGASHGRLHGWQGRRYGRHHSPDGASSEDPARSKTWLWAIQRSRGKSAVLLWDLQVPGTPSPVQSTPSSVQSTPSQVPGTPSQVLCTPREIEIEGARNIHTVSRRGRFLVASRGRDLRLVQATDGRELMSFDSVDLMEISPDERWVALAGGDAIRLVDLDAPQRVSAQLPLEATSPLEVLEISPNGHWLAVRAREGQEPGPGQEPAEQPGGANIWLWFVSSMASLPNDRPEISSQPILSALGCRFTFDPAGRQWAVAHTVTLQWFQLGDDGSCTLLGQYPLSSYPTVLAFDPDGDHIAVGGVDGSVVLLPRPEPEAMDVGSDTETLRRSDDNPQGQSVHNLTFDDAGERLAVALATPPQTHIQGRPGGTLGGRPRAAPHTLIVVYDLSSEHLGMLARACAGRVLDEAAWRHHLAPEPYRPGDLEEANHFMRRRLGIRPADPPKP